MMFVYLEQISNERQGAVGNVVYCLEQKPFEARFW